MSRTRKEREASVWRWIEAARKVSRLRDRFRCDLTQITKLSPDGVDLALDCALETDPSQAEVEALVGGATEAMSVTVVLSPNVFTASLRAIALAKAAADTVFVKASRREPFFARLLGEHARDAHVSFVNEVDYRAIASGEVHAYGSDSTLRTIAHQLDKSVVFRAHGTGFGVAYLDASAPIEACANALSRDVVLFDQSGCLSPRIAFVVGDADRAEAFASTLFVALASWAERVPRGELDDRTRADLRRYLDSMHMTGRVHEAVDCAVTLSGMATLPPAARVMHVVHVASFEEVVPALGALAPFVTTVGCHGAPPEMSSLARGHRMAALGMMQSPPFDGPVDPRRWPPSTLT